MVRKHIVAILFVASLLPVAGLAQPAQWSRLKIETLYESWHKANGALVNDVISLDSTNFRNQLIANPHVQYLDPPNADWMLMCYGDNSLIDQSRYDAIFTLKRQASNGYWVVPSSPVLAYPSGVVGYLGAGAGVTKTPVGTSGTNYRYFAIVTAEDRHGTSGGPGNDADDTGWVTWAASADGATWKFMNPSGQPVDNPLQSIHLIHTPTELIANSRWGHEVLLYQPVGGVNYFYIVLQYGGGCGIRATWWRVPFDSSKPWGIDPAAIQRLSNVATPPAAPVYRYVTTGGQTPALDNWQCDASDPREPALAIEPMDLVSLKKADGTFDSILFIYPSLPRYGRQPMSINYAKGCIPDVSTCLNPPDPAANFQWQTPRELDQSAFWDRTAFPSFLGTYSACGAGGGFSMSANQSGGALYGFASTWRRDLYPPNAPSCGWNCGYQSQGLLPFLFKQQNLGVDTVSPLSGPRSGGTTVTISGSGFLSGATVKLGGTSATNVSVLNSTTMSARTPVHAVGVANVRITNPGGTETDTRVNAFVYDFADVAAAHPYHADVVTIARNQVTVGCSSTNFCPDQDLNRAEMAVFLLKAKWGFLYPPPVATGLFFADVHPGDFAADWIEEFYKEGITAGCAGTADCAHADPVNTTYCPANPILREQMAVFLVKAVKGIAFDPPNCTSAPFPDVPCSSPFAEWIGYATNPTQGYMTGCGGGSFCPGAPVKRKEMAQHLAATFDLQ